MNYVLNEEKMFADITDGIAIIINSETGIYYGMNSFATNIYENIVKGAPTEKLLSELKTLNAAGLEENFQEFIKAMVDKEILIEGSPSDADITIDTDAANESGYILEFKEYDDAQELLLADPIHEVKEETGWAPEKEAIGYSKEETRKREEKVEV